MKIAIIILLSFQQAIAQDYVAHWKTVSREPGVVNYQVQIGATLEGPYTTIAGATFSPQRKIDSNVYNYTIQPQSADRYYRIKALRLVSTPPYSTNEYTVAKKLTNTNVNITNPLLKVQTSGDNLSFNTTNEAGVSYYLIERTINGSAWATVGKLTNKNTGKYIVNVSKTGITRRYKVTAFYFSGIKSNPISFQ